MTKPPTNKELAVERFASDYPPATMCAPLKLNSPFQCTRNVEVPAATRLSLSVAAAQAVFAVAGAAEETLHALQIRRELEGRGRLSFLWSVDRILNMFRATLKLVKFLSLTTTKGISPERARVFFAATLATGTNIIAKFGARSRCGCRAKSHEVQNQAQYVLRTGVT